MQCPHCEFENPAAHRFCGGCGAPLPRACADCGFANPADGKFCGGCGKPLGQAPAATTETPAATADAPAVSDVASAAGAEGERRQVTILFADLVGFTTLSSEIDAEELHALMSRFFDTVDQVIEAFGGRVDKHIGDAVMALFGAPVAHGDDPARAVRAAFEIHRTLEILSAELGRDLAVHVGIASGQVVAGGLGRDGSSEYTVLGDSVNLASRLDALAGPGEILVSEAVFRSVADQVEASALGEIAVKGLERPARVWRLETLKTGAPDGRRQPLVGRRAELGQFAGVIEACRDSGRGHVIVLRGEAGMGKTRLLAECTTLAAARDFTCHRGLVLDFGVGQGQDAIRSLVRSLLTLEPGSDTAERERAAERAIAEGDLDPDQRVFLNDLLDLPQPTELRALYDAMDNGTRNLRKHEVVAALVEVASGRSPLLLAVEDIHWADELTLSHLARIAASVQECRALLIMTTRLEGDPLDQAWHGAAQGSAVVTIDLAPLRAAEAAALAGTFSEAQSAFAEACIARAGGNPLFLEQLLLNAEETDDSEVPGSIQSLVLARVDRLAPTDKRALQAASVIGQRFSPALLGHLLGGADFHCGGLAAQSLVRPDGEDFLFAHALVRDGVYASLLKSRRRDLHKQAAAWFTEHDPVLSAQHLDRAEDPRAAKAYLEAARIQQATYHFDAAMNLVQRGLALVKDGADSHALTCLLGELHYELGAPGPSIVAYERALDLAGDDVMRCQAWIGLASGMRVSDDLDRAFEVLDQAEAAAQAHGLERQLARIHHLRGNLYFPLGRLEDCQREHDKALDYARRTGSPEFEARALSGLGDVNYGHGRMVTARDYYQRCIELSREHGFGRIEVANLSMLGTAQRYLAELDTAERNALAAAEAAVRVGQHRAEMIALRVAIDIAFDKAEPDKAGELLVRSKSLVERLGARRFEPLNSIFEAKLRCGEGHRKEASALLERALATSRETEVRFSGPWVLGAVALVTEDPERRKAALVEGEKLLAEGAISHNYFWFYRDAMDACLEAGAWDEVERYAAALESYTAAEPMALSDVFIARGRALAAYGRDPGNVAAIEELRGLRVQAEGIGLRITLPAIDAALAQADRLP
jgi:class 3 adenylate cyclase/tetratricopeptide (TPR) repeat protein